MNEHLNFGRFRFQPQTARLCGDEQESHLTRKAAAALGHGMFIDSDEIFGASAIGRRT